MIDDDIGLVRFSLSYTIHHCTSLHYSMALSSHSKIYKCSEMSSQILYNLFLTSLITVPFGLSFSLTSLVSPLSFHHHPLPPKPYHPTSDCLF